MPAGDRDPDLRPYRDLDLGPYLDPDPQRYRGPDPQLSSKVNEIYATPVWHRFHLRAWLRTHPDT